MKKRGFSIAKITRIAVFAAMFVVIFFIKIPFMDKYIHLGNVVAILAVLTLGMPEGLIASLVGVFFADILSGYGPYVIETMILYTVKIGFIGFAFPKLCMKISERKAIVVSIIGGFLLYMLSSFIIKSVMLILSGSDVGAALISSLLSQTSSIINLITSIIFVLAMYPSLKKIIDR